MEHFRVACRVGLHALLQVTHRVQQDAPRRNDGGVAGAEVLLRAVGDAAHAVRHREVLVPAEGDAGVVLLALHLPVDEVVILRGAPAAVGVDGVAAGELVLDALQLHRIDGAGALFRREGALAVVAVLEGDDVLVVDGHPTAAAPGPRRSGDEAEHRQHPLGHAPVVGALLRASPRAVGEAVVRLLDRQLGRAELVGEHRVPTGLLVSGAHVRVVVNAEVKDAVQEGDVAGVYLALRALHVVGVLNEPRHHAVVVRDAGPLEGGKLRLQLRRAHVDPHTAPVLPSGIRLDLDLLLEVALGGL